MEILVLFDSKGGNVYKLAKAVAEGIEQVEDIKARMRWVKETTPMEVIRANETWSKFYDFKSNEITQATLDDLVETEGLAMGCPTRFGNVSPAMGNFLESTGPLWSKGALVGKVAGVFTSTSTMHGGNEATLITMMVPLMHLGYIIVPMGYVEPNVASTDRGGTPYGPSSVSGLGEPTPTEKELLIARAFGRRLAETTKRLRS
ncbi:MAG: NAD(P)H:quinone oxidoreductase [Armatimonadota bacterium]|nr:NAD(P)H:quinone oxidoreductase [Armatimonadota bacterium]